MADIFFSYAHGDIGRIRDLVKVFEDQGWIVFWDRNIPAGRTWRSHIGHALSDARCVVVAWSRNSVNSNWVTEEAEEARKRGVLVPILLDDVEPPLGFRSVQAADLTDSQRAGRSAQLDQLIHDLASVLAPSSTATTTAETRQSSNAQTAKIERQAAHARRHRWYALLGTSLLAIAITTFVYWNHKRLPDAQTTTPDISAISREPSVPDIRKAKRELEALAEGDLLVTGGNVRESAPDGSHRYFRIKVAPRDAAYAVASVQMKDEVKPHYFASVRLRAGPGIGTLELQGRDVWFLVDSTYEHYMIWNTDGNQTPWLPIRVKIDHKMNTLGIYQIGRQAHVFLNSTYVDSFQLWNEPSLGRVGVYIKADAKSGGEAEFERLAVWEF